MKKNEVKQVSKIAVKRAILDILSEFERTLNSREKDARTSYEEVGLSDEQATDWRTGELKWEDEEQTKPIYKPIYDYVEKQELTEEDTATLEAIETVRKALEALI